MMEIDALIFRLADHEDLSAVAEVFIEARTSAPMPPIPAPLAVVRADIVGWDLAFREVWLAENNNVVIGFATLTGDWLESLYVLPGCQGMGVGTALLGWAMAMRPDGFGLWVFEENEHARAFYRRHGLLELERTDGSANPERQPDVRMAWQAMGRGREIVGRRR